MTKSVDADEVQLKYMVHVFSGSSEKELLFFSKPQMYSMQSGLERCQSRLALESSPCMFS